MSVLELFEDVRRAHRKSSLSSNEDAPSANPITNRSFTTPVPDEVKSCYLGDGA